MTRNTTLGRSLAWAIACSAALLAGCGGGGGGSSSGGTAAGNPVLTVAPSTLPPPSLGVPYSATLGGSGAPGPYTFSISAGALPAGLHLNGYTGVINGTPTQAGVFGVTVQAVATNADFGQESYSMVVVGALTITTTSLPAGEERVAYEQRVHATGGVGPYTWSVAGGALPAGLSLAPSTGLSVLVTGAPAAPVTAATFTLRVQDAEGRSTQKQLAITVANTYRVFFTADLDTAGVNELYEAVLDDNLNPRAPVRVSGTINPSDGDVSASFQLSPDGKKIAYLADAGFDAVTELFIADVSGGTPGPARRVNSPFTNINGGKATSFRWSPDSTKIAWIAEAFAFGQYNLFFADVTGATLTQRQANPPPSLVLGFPVGPINTGSSAEDYAWSSDSRYLAFEADTRSSNRSALQRFDAYVCDTTTPLNQTPTAARVNLPNLVNNGTVPWLQWIPGQNTLVFADNGGIITTVTGTTTVATEVFWTAISGSVSATTPVMVPGRYPELNVPNVSPGVGGGCDFSPLGTKLAVLYSGNTGFLSNAMYLAPVLATGLGSPVAVTTTPRDPTQSKPSYIQGYAWSPDARLLLLGGGVQTQNVQCQLATCDVSGAVPGALVPIPVTPRQVHASLPYKALSFTADSSAFVYTIGQGASPFFTDLNFQRVVTTPVSTMTQISGTINALGGNVGLPSGQADPMVFLSPDGRQVAYISEENVDDRVELFAVDVGGNLPGPSVRISPTPASVTGDVQAMPVNNTPVFKLGATPANACPQWNSTSRFLLFRGDLTVDERYDLLLWDSTQVGAPVVSQVVPSLASRPGALGVTGFKLVD